MSGVKCFFPLCKMVFFVFVFNIFLHKNFDVILNNKMWFVNIKRILINKIVLIN